MLSVLECLSNFIKHDISFSSVGDRVIRCKLTLATLKLFPAIVYLPTDFQALSFTSPQTIHRWLLPMNCRLLA
ncbi:hypothetical protein CAter282_1319 [Collimonas arenae]|uniref:Uncharacterized protein n=1 Tax=Collimonas arenae TaxID=279058 RepID=A0A127QGC6_9BURK|nr:hypothetical protein CAter10_1417 [Collimonas arenae]AMP09110.1 hypothetical protein CAter282_1319 [Collimonas arenae]